jgi:hypothetical protein
MSKITTTLYLHSNKETNWEEGNRLGLRGEALHNFLYTNYEVKLKMEVNTETGTAFIIEVDGRPVV